MLPPTSWANDSLPRGPGAYAPRLYALVRFADLRLCLCAEASPLPSTVLYHSRFTIYDLLTMAKWTFEPGHTAAEFRARHMMVTYVRGHFKDVHGSLNFDPKNPEASSVEVTIDARKIWTGEPARDEHLRSADFLDAENFPEITFRGNEVSVMAENDYGVTGNFTIRGATNPLSLAVNFLGLWQTPWLKELAALFSRTRVGLVAKILLKN